jgi:hypothetical protein
MPRYTVIEKSFDPSHDLAMTQSGDLVLLIHDTQARCQLHENSPMLYDQSLGYDDWGDVY